MPSFLLKTKIQNYRTWLQQSCETFTQKPIKQTTQDSDPSPLSSSVSDTDQSPYTKSSLRYASVLASEFIPVLLVLLIPVSVHAGVLASFLNAFSDEVITADLIERVEYTATETPLLSAQRNVDPQAAIGGGDILVTEGTLVSTGPVGEDDIAHSEINSGEISVYTVRAGDTLSQIAEMFDVTTNTILWANDLRSAKDIHAGDTLVILPIIGVQHIVKKGESLGKIVKKYEANFDEVLAYNGLSSADALSVGDELIIPGGEIATPKRIAVAPTPTKSSGGSSAGFVHPSPGSIRTQGIHGYNAVDLAASYGAPIRAAAAGEVIVAKSGGWNGGYGNYIVVRHGNGSQTLYAHNSANYVASGDWVSAGETIAAMGSTGRSTGVHVHFEVRGASNPF